MHLPLAAPEVLCLDSDIRRMILAKLTDPNYTIDLFAFQHAFTGAHVVYMR